VSLRDIAKRLPWGMRKIAAFLALYRAGLLWGKQFAGVYDSFDDLHNDASEEAWAANALAHARAPKIDPATNFPVLIKEHALPALAVSLLSTMTSDGVRVLDFGGGAGIDFLNLTYALPVMPPLSYTVVELPAVCAAGRERWRSDERITFLDALPAAGTSFDLIWSWCAIQYVPRPLDVLARFVTYRPRAMLLVSIPVTAGPRSFVRNQVTGNIPQWVLNCRDIEASIAPGYRIAGHWSTDDDLNVDGTPEPYRVPNMSSLLFLPR